MHNSQLLRNSNHKSSPAQQLSDSKFASSLSINAFPAYKSQPDLFNSLTEVTFCVLYTQLSSGKSNMSLYLPIHKITYCVQISVESSWSKEAFSVSLYLILTWKSVYFMWSLTLKLRLSATELVSICTSPKLRLCSCATRGKLMWSLINSLEQSAHKPKPIGISCAQCFLAEQKFHS